GICLLAAWTIGAACASTPKFPLVRRQHDRPVVAARRHEPEEDIGFVPIQRPEAHVVDGKQHTFTGYQLRTREGGERNRWWGGWGRAGGRATGNGRATARATASHVATRGLLGVA